MRRSERRYRLTPMQEGMLFHSLSAPGTGVEIEQIVCTSREPFDVAVLEESWRRVVARHEALRLVFRWAGLPAPVQEVVEGWSPELEVHPAALGLDDALAMDRRRDFDLERACMRIALQPPDPDGRWRMLWTFHHAILDGRSFPIVLRELFDCYSALTRGEEWIPPAPAAQFSSFVQHVASSNVEQSRDFWESLLAGVERPDHELVARGRGANSGDFGAVEERLSAEDAARLGAFAGERQVTLNTLLQAAWAVTLHNHTRSFDAVMGATRACRHVPVEGIGELVGLLINTLPVRVDLRGPALGDLLARLRADWLAMRAHELTPLSDVQRWAGVDGALFDSIVVFDDAELRERMRAPGGEWLERDFAYYGRTGYPLTLIGYGGREPLLRLEYDRALVPDDRAERLLTETAHALRGMPAHVDAPPARLPVHSAAERARLLALALPGLAATPRGTIVDRIRLAASGKPNERAVAASDGALSYPELLERAERVAGGLARRGIGRGSRVGVSLERAADAVVTMLGVMAAGACYVPMDTDLPLERVRLIERDAELGLMVVSEHTPADGGAPRVTPAELEAAGPGPHAVPLPDDVAYVIYTSGSTGTPKGVAVTHANVTALLDGCARIFDFGAADAWSCFHSFAFDFSVWEIWCALMTGGTTVVATRAETRSPARFAELLARESVTILSQTPSAFRALRDEVLARPRSDFRLRHVVFGGEALDPTTLREWFDAFGDETPRMTNMYGITETTVHVTHHRLTRADSRGAASPIGRPLPHLGVLLLNAGGGLAPAGAPAELLVTGAGVAQGYLGRAELTASRFPVLSEPSGARAYRSGDLARLEADGTLTFLSRADAQVKVRGHRIEPGEIEDVLRRHERVADARVVARRSEAGAVDLAAYVIASGSMPAAAELREHVLRSLPPYMVPRWFVAVAAFPLTRNGKLDVAALPRPEAERDAGIEFVAPAGTLEQSIARVWCDVLGVEAVGTRDNFFDLGGDSLMLVRVAGRLSEALGRRIEVVKLFEFTTVSSLAAHLAAAAPPDAERYEEVAARAARQRGNFLAARRG